MNNSKGLKKKLSKHRKNFEDMGVSFFDDHFLNDIKTMQMYSENKDISLMYNKEISKVKIDFDTKNTQCRTCGNDFTGNSKISGRCKSHNIPAFVLKNVEGIHNKNKRLATISTIVPNLNYKEYEGTNNCDTFKMICRSCDSKIFSKYEDASTLLDFKNTSEDVSQGIMNTIALKILLKDVYYYNTTHGIGEFSELNKKMSEKSVAEALNPEKEYNLIYFNKLNYNVGFTAQDKILPDSILDGKKIHNLTSHKMDNPECYLYVCVYPIGDETMVLVFSDDTNSEFYTVYKKYLANTSEDVALKNISYNLIKYTEKMYFNPNIFTKDLWSEKDTLLFISEYYEFKERTGLINFTMSTRDYLNIKNITDETVTNFFEINKPKKH